MAMVVVRSSFSVDPSREVQACCAAQYTYAAVLFTLKPWNSTLLLLAVLLQIKVKIGRLNWFKGRCYLA